MEQKILFEKAQDIIHAVVGVDSEKITLDSYLREDLQADSLASVEIVMALEDCFDIEISEELASRLVTVGDLIQAIEVMLASKRAEAV